MQSANATEIQNHFGRFLDQSYKGPIQIMRNGRKSGAIISQEEFELFQKLENDSLLAQIQEVLERNDFMSHEESMAWLLKNSERAGILNNELGKNN